MKEIAVKTEIAQYNLNSMNLNSMVDRFVQYLDVSQLSIRSYISGVKVFLKYLSDNCINTPTRETILQYKKDLALTKSANTISLYLSSIRKFFAWCESEGLYQDITKGVKNPRIDTGHKKDAFTAQQIKQIISGIDRNTLKGKRDYALFCLISATGLRTCEVMRADIRDLRNVYGENCLYIQGKGRNSKTDFVKISEHVMSAISAYLEARGHVSDDEPLFASLSNRNSGKRMTTRSISRICKSAMRHSGFDSRRLTAHSLRHTAATVALQAGATLRQVQQVLRHTSIAITQIYLHDLDRLNNNAECLVAAQFGL